jgi:hypothetical protein
MIVGNIAVNPATVVRFRACQDRLRTRFKTSETKATERYVQIPSLACVARLSVAGSSLQPGPGSSPITGAEPATYPEGSATAQAGNPTAIIETGWSASQTQDCSHADPAGETHAGPDTRHALEAGLTNR